MHRGFQLSCSPRCVAESAGDRQLRVLVDDERLSIEVTSIIPAIEPTCSIVLDRMPRGWDSVCEPMLSEEEEEEVEEDSFTDKVGLCFPGFVFQLFECREVLV